MRLYLLTALLLYVSLSCTQALSSDIEFDSGQTLPPVDESTLPPPLDTEFADPKGTGSYLFKVDDPEDANWRLTLNFRITDFKSSQSDYYRAHPVFMRCLQKIYNHVKTLSGHKIQIMSGYRLTSDIEVNPSIAQQYSSSGCAATLSYQDTSQTDLLLIAQAAITHCMPMFGYEMRDLGLVMLTDGVHVHMAGTTDHQPYFDTDGYSELTNTEFVEWSWQHVDETLDAKKTPQCLDIAGLEVGQSYPAEALSAEHVVGIMDVKVSRDMTDDFARMVQFADSDKMIEFEGCSSKMDGHAAVSRCSNRLMSTRLYSAVRLLQKMVRERIDNGKLKVVQAWVEDNSLSNHSLYYEGRAARLQLSADTDQANLKTLSMLAICAGLDFVKHQGDEVMVAVRQQASLQPITIEFPQTQVLQVVPPSQKEKDYELPAVYTDDYPLFDSDNQGSVKLGEFAEVDMFKSDDAEYRYYRLHPAMVQCYDAILHFENKYSDKPVDVRIVRSFLSSSELREHLDPEIDVRGHSYSLGLALEVIYEDCTSSNHSKCNIHRLAEVAVQECGAIFFHHDSEIGLGLYENSLYIDMREVFQVWLQDDSMLPVNTSLQSYSNQLATRLIWTIEGLLINPEQPEEALTREVNPPQRQSADYRHQRPEQTQEPDGCEPRKDTDFCKETKIHREIQVNHTWAEMKLMHIEHDEDEVKSALIGCLGSCGTCVEGGIYEEKVENCDNLLHWTPFRLLNTQTNDSNLYMLANQTMKEHACSEGRHCLNKSPLYAQLVSSIEAIYRPDPEQSVQQELYAVNDNPLPVYQLLMDIYAIEAVGTLTVWVHNDQELKDIRNPLKVAMVYNKEISDVVIHVADTESVESVEQTMQAMITDWTRTTHPMYSRPAVSPVLVQPLAPDILMQGKEEPVQIM